MEKIKLTSNFDSSADLILFEGDILDLLPKVPDGFTNLVVTSPPYNIDKPYEEKLHLDDYLSQQEKVIKECVRVLNEKGSICWQVGNFVRNGEIIPLDILLFPIFSSLNLCLRNRIVWHFGHGLHASKRFSGRYEVILWFTKGDHYTFNLNAVRVPQKYPDKKHFKGPNKGNLALYTIEWVILVSFLYFVFMNSTQLFEKALALSEPWHVDRLEFKTTSSNLKELHIHLNFTRGAKFTDTHGKSCSVHDTVERSWQHLDFFQHRCILHARVPRIKTSTGEVKRVEVPWARPNSGFTLLFEAFAMSLIENEMPVNKVAKTLFVHASSIWSIFHHWIDKALAQTDHSQVTAIGIDETSSKKGHSYVTLAVDFDKRRVIFVTKGKDEKTISRLKTHLEDKGVTAKKIKHICMDMSPAFIAGSRDNFPESELIFDRFHVVKLLNEAMDDVRKKERKEHDALKGHKYIFLKNRNKLSHRQKDALCDLIQDFPTLGEAYRLKEIFNDFWDFKDPEEAMAFLAYWCDLVHESNIRPLMKFANTIKTHWSGIVSYTKTQMANGILEGINSKIQLAKRRARGYRNIENFIKMIYFIAGKLQPVNPLYCV
jgi:transposase